MKTVTEENSRGISRRNFLMRSAKAGLSVLAGGCAGYFLHDTKGPDPLASGKETVRLPDFSISGLNPKMAVAEGSERIQTLNRALEALGGMEEFIKKGDRVLLKVNAAFASPPVLSATTHPDMVSEVTRLCLKAGARSVLVTDNPINDPNSCFSLSGIAEAADNAGAEVFIPRDIHFKSTSVDGGSLIRNWPILYSPFKGINKLIGLAPVKDHHRSGASMTMKNWYGLLGGRRNIFHQDIHNIIKELAMLVKPTLVILDGMTTMVSNGPTGGSLSDLKKTNTIVASTDQVAADSFGASLLGKSPEELPFIMKAQQKGLGTSDFDVIKPVRVS